MESPGKESAPSGAGDGIVAVEMDVMADGRSGKEESHSSEESDLDTYELDITDVETGKPRPQTLEEAGREHFHVSRLQEQFAATIHLDRVCYRAKALEVRRRLLTVRQMVRETWHVDRKRTILTPPLLQDITLTIEPGDFILVLGVPGCGKSSLFKLLSNSLPAGDVNGFVWWNNEPLNPRNHHHKVSHVPQTDLHIAELTVRETLEFAVALQLDPDMMLRNLREDSAVPFDSEKIRDERIRRVLRILKIEGCQDTLVGNALIRGVSGGERRRCTIAVDMMKSPQLLLLDSPTDGLDSATAINLGKALRALSKLLAPVMAAMLQPPPGLYKQFNKILLMTSDGRIAFFGKREEAAAHFASLGFQRPSSRMSMAEFLPDILENPSRYASGPCSCRSNDDFVNVYNASEYKKSVERTIRAADKHRKEGSGPSHSNSSNIELAATLPRVAVQDRYVQNRFWQYWYLLKREAQRWRHFPQPQVGKIVISLFLGLFMGTLFLQIGHSQGDIILRQGLVFNIALLVGMKAASVIPMVLNDRPIVMFQRSRRYFAAIPLFFSSITLFIPFLATDIAVFGSLAYWLAALRETAEAFFFLVLVAFILGFACDSVYRIGAYISPSLTVAQNLGPSIFVMFIAGAGFFISRNRMPEWMIWTFWGSPFRYAYEALTINELLGVRFYCDPDELQPPASDPLLFAPYELGGYEGNQICPIQSGTQVLIAQDMETEEEWKWIWMSVLFGITVMLNVMGYLLLRCVWWSEPLHRISPKEDVKQSQYSLALKSRAGSFVMSKQQTKQSLSGVSVSISNLSYEVDFEGNTKHLLSDISAYAKPGMIVALMGPSGAGKTTLLDVIAGRKTGGRISGKIEFNGKTDTRYLHRFSGYVEQMNIHIETATVKEAFFFSARTRCGADVCDEDILYRVEDVLVQVGLEDKADYMIQELGMVGRKLVTIGVEIVADCEVLFLDEPTSGLDSLAALKVMKIIDNCASEGKTIICTIHQPSFTVFQYFSHLLLLKRGGELAYFGRVENMPAYFQETCGFRALGKSENPADYALDAATAIESVAQDWAQSESAEKNSEFISKGVVPESIASKEWEYDTYYASTAWQQFKVLYKRAVKKLWRNPMFLRVKSIKLLILSVFLGLLFFQRPDDQPGARERFSLFFALVLVIVLNAYGMFPVITADRPAFYRETSGGFYRESIYLLTFIMSDLPFTLIHTTVFSIPVYWISGLAANAGTFFFFWMITFLSFLMLSSFVIFLGFALPAVEAGNLIAGILTLCFNMVAGFFLPKRDIPPYYIWLHYISIVRFPLELYAINEFEDEDYHCPNNEGAYPIPVPDCNVTNVGGPVQSLVQVCSPRVQFYCPIENGNEFLDLLDIDKSMKWPWVGIMIGIYAIFLSLSLLVLKKLRFINR